jgi:uncharacterized surface protein with fasciclin (FAS1) repeats
MKHALVIILLNSLPLAGISIANEEAPNPQETAAANPAPNPPDEERELVETLKTSGYTVFAELLEMSGVIGELKKGEPFTCFAPRNDAFDLEIFKQLKEQPKNDELVDLVKYHLIQGNQTKDIILISRRERTLSGKFLIYWISKGDVRINNHSAIIEPDIKAKGGVIHGVSKVLSPDDEGAIP